jgi:myo-inositol-1(or 4)-monophosphatase
MARIEHQDLAELAGLAQDALREASSIIRTEIGAGGERTAKGSRDFATAADIQIERAVRQLLKDRTPEIGFFGEESGGGDPAAGRPTWVLDPIDGTVNFAYGLPLCGSSLALYDNGQPIIGAIDLPLLGESYIAARGHGAWLNGQRIQVQPHTRLAEALTVFGDVKREAAPVIGALAERSFRVRQLGSAAVALAWVAAGRVGALFTFANKSYDVGAGAILAREAGACVFDRDGKDHNLASRWTLVGHPLLRDEMLELCRLSR